MTDHSGVIFRAGALAGIGQHDRAIALLGAALAEDPLDAELLAELAGILAKADRPEDAIAAARASLAIEPTMLAPRLTLAKVAIDQNRYDDALTASEEVLVDHPRLPQAHAYRAVALAFGADATLESVRQQARESYRITVEDSIATPGYYYLAAVVERKLKDEKAAARLASAGLAIDPTFPPLLEFTAESVSTPTRDKVSILSGLLAQNPTNQSYRTSIVELHRHVRRSRRTLQWFTVLAVAVVATITDGFPTVVGTAGVLLVAVLLWRRRRDAAATVPDAVRRSRGGPITKSIARASLVAWALSLAAGAVLLAVGAPAGSVLLLVAVVAWAFGAAVVDIEEFRGAAREDTLHGETEAPRFARRAFTGNFLIAPMLVVAGALGAFFDGPVVTAVSASIALLLVVESLVLISRSAPYHPGRIAVVILLIPGSLAGLQLAAALSQFPTAARREPPAASDVVDPPSRSPSPAPLSPEQLYPEYAPTPSFDFDFPSIDFPTPSFDFPTPSDVPSPAP